MNDVAVADQVAELETRETELAVLEQEDWRLAFSNGDAKHVQHLQRYHEPAQAYRALRSRKGDGAQPRSLEEYGKVLPLDQLKIFTPVIEAYRKHGTPAEEVLSALQAHVQSMEADIALDLAKQDQAYLEESQGQLLAEHGPKEYIRMQSILSVFLAGLDEEGMGVMKALESARDEEGRLLGHRPDVIRLFANIADRLYPQSAFLPPGHDEARGRDIDEEIASLELEMRDTRGREPGGYWNDNRKQERYRELLDWKARSTGDARRDHARR